MNAVRVPIIAGVTHGVGTTTLAAALHGHDRGRYTGGPVDVLVCRPGSLARAASLPGVAVLVVVADDAVADTVRARIRHVESHFGAVVLLPHAAPLRDTEDPLALAAGVLGLPPGGCPPALRSYADGLLAVVGALLHTGALLHGAHPGPAAPPVGGVARDTSAATAAARPVRSAPAPADRAPVLLRTAEPLPQPVRIAGPTPLRAVPVRSQDRGAAPLVVTPPLVVTSQRLAAVPSALPTPPRITPDSTVELDDDALEAEPYLHPHLHRRTG